MIGALRTLALVFLLALSLEMPPPASHAAELSEVNCGGFALGYDGEALYKKCRQATIYGNQTQLDVQQLVVSTGTGEIILTYYASKFRSYIPIQPLRQIIDQSHFFSETANWQAIHKYAGFEVAAFDGFERAGSTPTLCAGFARFSGNPPNNYEYQNGPGYKNLAAGVFCVFAADRSIAEPIDKFYQLVDSILAKLRLPG